jgi:GH43 family beta-xylosidase
MRLGGALLALGLVAAGSGGTALAAPPSPATTGSQSTIEPVIDSDFADPDFLLVDGVYHAYATNTTTQNVQHQTSTDLITWTAQGDVLPVLGEWTGPCETRADGTLGYCVWAPEVAAVEGGYALYYTAHSKAAQDEGRARQCIGVALSDSPDGPFVPVGDGPLVCPDGEGGTVDLGGAIDAATYTEDGRLYLLWKSDGNCCASPVPAPVIYLQPLSADGTTLTGPPVELIRLDQAFEGRVVEAPTLIKQDGTYYLFYSANDYYGGGYRTAYATSSSLTGPYTKATTELMTTDLFQGDVIGPGGQDVIQNADGTTSILFHGWDPTYSYRGVYLSNLEFSADGVPSVEAAATRYQAEDGALTGLSRVVGDRSASGGEKVGGMDTPTSSVTLQVYADQAGPATLGIRYANGSEAGGVRLLATDSVTVNGRAAGTVTFAHTTWGNWQLVEHQVVLKKGLNTITLTKLTNFAEIDSVDVYEGQPSATPAGPPAPTTGTRVEAESGVVFRGGVRNEASASGGQVVGGLDFDNSTVTLQVCVAKAGPTTLGIRYSNGSERGGYPVEATHDILVNGQDAGTVTFAHTRWGNWTTVEHQVLLKKGCNTVTFDRVSFFVELDSVDVF